MFFIVSFMLFYTVVLVRNIFYNLTDFICFIFIKISQCKVIYFEWYLNKFYSLTKQDLTINLCIYIGMCRNGESFPCKFRKFGEF